MLKQECQNCNHINGTPPITQCNLRFYTESGECPCTICLLKGNCNVICDERVDTYRTVFYKILLQKRKEEFLK